MSGYPQPRSIKSTIKTRPLQIVHFSFQGIFFCKKLGSIQHARQNFGGSTSGEGMQDYKLLQSLIKNGTRQVQGNIVVARSPGSAHVQLEKSNVVLIAVLSAGA